MMWLGIAFQVADGRWQARCLPPVVLALCEFWASFPEVISGVLCGLEGTVSLPY